MEDRTDKDFLVNIKAGSYSGNRIETNGLLSRPILARDGDDIQKKARSRHPYDEKNRPVFPRRCLFISPDTSMAVPGSPNVQESQLSAMTDPVTSVTKQIKKHKSDPFCHEANKWTGTMHLHSEDNSSNIISALSLADEQSDLTGDFSKMCCLPLIHAGIHQDLKSISAKTVRLYICIRSML